MNTMNTIIQQPKLIEPGVRYFLSSTLKECRKFKDYYSNIAFNLIMASVLFIVIGGFLLYMYKGKLTPYELDIKQRKKQEYIISKLHQIAYIKKNQSQNRITNMITNLPEW
jgi:hypothetical protein